MTAQHGRHQALWEALVDYAAVHRDNACTDASSDCEATSALLREFRATVENADDAPRAIRELLEWLSARCAETIIANARTTATDAGHPVVLTLEGRGTIGRACRMLFAAHITGGGELPDLLDACTASPSVAGEISAALLHQLATALVERLEQLGTIGAHP